MAHLSRTYDGVLLVIISICCIHGSLSGEEKKDRLTAEDMLFREFIVEHEKKYSPGTIEYEKRFRVFQQSLQRSEKLNIFSRKHNGTAVYGITQFSDLTPEEFQEQYLTLKPYQPSTSANFKPAGFVKIPGDVPKKYDLRDLKAVTPVRDQKSCGGCWAFSTVEGMATKRALKGGPLTTLSSQQLIDCDLSDSGCSGGDTCSTMKWLQVSRTGVVEERRYPFVARTGQCKMVNMTNGVRMKSHTCESYSDESNMVSALYKNGSLVVAVDATSWQDYLGGIIQHHCSHNLNNHAVQVIGYDTAGQIPYYIVRNSWGPKWGLDGYLRVRIGGNVCGIASRVSTVDVE
ncbi:cathepsin O-like [Ptychodera flava]|uniref:cathepsin O-like n=1 Tax=Ptychodera flava TaxID=63121 RepID=UPI00396A60A4